MEKVKVTEKQAYAVERIRKEQADNIDNVKSYGFHQLDDWEIPLFELETDEIMSALYIGYEVEPEFKVGDWVTNDGLVSLITKIENDIIYTDHALDYKRNCGSTAYMNTLSKFFFHSSPEEIAKEKTRRFFAENDRDVWELKIGDVLRYRKATRFIRIIERINALGEYVTHENYTVFTKEEIKESFEVFCFAEDRKDA